MKLGWACYSSSKALFAGLGVSAARGQPKILIIAVLIEGGGARHKLQILSMRQFYDQGKVIPDGP